MAHRVVFRPKAEDDLQALYDYIADQAGLTIAAGYIGRIEAACMGLAQFPERGARRDDLGPGLRVLGFERRAAIVFRVLASEVEIITIAYGGRGYEDGFSEKGE